MIEVRELSKRYGSQLVVDELSFDVRPGHVTGFLGPNGAGKSTTMRMILGLDLPSAGSVTIDGLAYHKIRRPLHQVGAVLEAGAVHGGRSAHDHLLCLAQSNGIGVRRVREVLDLVGLSSVGRRRAGRFSLGMSQRLGFAAALLGDPRTLICDEPINGLDPEGIRWVRTFLRERAAEGRTVFVSSHLMSEMALTADHLIVIAQGRLVAQASTAAIIEGSALNYVRVRTTDPDRLARVIVVAGGTLQPSESDGVLHVTGLTTDQIGDLAAEHRTTLHELSAQQGSLESAFLELTSEHVDFRTPLSREVA